MRLAEHVADQRLVGDGVQEAGVDEDADVGDPRQPIADLVAAILDPADERAAPRRASPVSRPSWVIARSTWRIESPGAV